MTTPDFGDTFAITTELAYRKWQWLPFPWKRRRVYREVDRYRVTGWMRRRPAPPPPRDEQESLVRQMLGELRAKDPALGPRGAGPDNVPLEFCLPEQAEYVCGAGVGGCIVRVSEVTVDGRVPWPAGHLAAARESALKLAGEPLW
jgi:hypothetical protein